LFNENLAVARLSELFALSLGYSSSKARLLRNAAALHDIGKMKIKPDILNKPGKLTLAEFDEMKLHTKYGAEMLQSIQGELGNLAATIAQYHHEWHNGRGYWGIPTSQLPYCVSIVSIVDVFVACCASRPYKNPWPPERTLEYLQNQAGTQFSPRLVTAFVYLIRESKSVPAIINFGRCLC